MLRLACNTVNLSIILPCYNEEQNIAASVQDVHEWMKKKNIEGEIIVVNDGSTDGTADVLQSLVQTYDNLCIVSHHPNKGYGAAVRAGCDRARSDIVAFMDSDGQFRAEDFDRLLPHLERFAFVTGRRRRRADPFMRKLNAKLFGLLTWVVLGVWVRDVNCAMKIFRRDIWQRIRPVHATGALVNAEMFLNLKKNGIAWHQVDVPHYPRKFGAQTGANLSVILKMFRELLTLAGAKL